MKTWFAAVFMIFVCISASSQPAEIGSVRIKLAQQRHKTGYEKDTAYINNLAKLAHLFYALDADSLFFYAHEALELSQKIKYERGIAESLRQVGNGYMLTGDFVQTLYYYQQSLSLAERMKDKRLICLSLSNIGLNYFQMGKYDVALSYSLKAYNLATALGDKLRVAGELDNLAEIYFAKKEYSKAFDYAYKAIQMAIDLKNDYYVAFLNSSLGGMLYARGQNAEAFKYFQQSLAYYVKTNDQLGITNTDLLIAKVYLKNKGYGLALKYATESLSLAKNKKEKKDIADAAQTLSDIYEAQGDDKIALQYLKTVKTYNDSLFNDESQKKLFELQAKYKYEQEEALLKGEQAKKDLANNDMLQNQKQQMVIAALIIFALGIIVITLYKSRADKLKINKVLQEKNVEINRQKEEIELQAAALRTTNGQKDKLFSVIAHDLRSPLISLQSLLTLFKDDAMPIGKVQEILARLNTNVDQTVSLVTNLLSWAASQMNGMEVHIVCFSINETITQVIAGMEKPAADKGIALTLETKGDIKVLADKDMMELVVRNLLSNAVKFCRAGDGISIYAKQQGGSTEVCITDTGVGMAEGVLHKINNGESITTYGTSKEKGTGLGLLLCKDFIARNNGTFRIESEAGRGSKFYFTLNSA